MNCHREGKQSLLVFYTSLVQDKELNSIPESYFNPVLKGHCHENFAVLGQFCAKIITLRL